MGFRILITGPDLRAVTQPIDGWTQFDATLRHNAVGSGSFVAPATRALLTAVSTPNNRVQIIQEPAPALGIPGEVLISGPIEKPGAYRWSLESEQDAGPGMVTVGFADNLAYLSERITWPAPGAPASAQGTDYYIATNINAEQLMHALVNLNAGPGALPGVGLADRRVPHLALGALNGVGTPVNVTTRFEPLTDVLRYAADAGGGLAFRVREVGGQLLFEVSAPPVRSGARFGRSRGNLRSLSTDPEAPTATVAVVGGTGTGAGRLVVERQADTAWRRIETFVNQNGVSTTAGLEQYGDQALAEKAEKVGLSAVPIDGALVRYGVHYRVSDLVPVELATGSTLIDRVMSVRIQGTPEQGAVYTPTIGSSDPTTDRALVRAWRDMQRRLGRTERT